MLAQVLPITSLVVLSHLLPVPPHQSRCSPCHQSFYLIGQVVLPSHQARGSAPSAQLFSPNINLALPPQVTPAVPLHICSASFPITSAQLYTPISWFFFPYIFSGHLLWGWQGYTGFFQGSLSGIARGSPLSAPTSLTHMGSRGMTCGG